MKKKEEPKKKKSAYLNIYRRVTGLWENKMKNGKSMFKSCKLDDKAWSTLQTFGDETRLEILPNRKRSGPMAPSHNLYVVPLGEAAKAEKESMRKQLAQEEKKKEKAKKKADKK